MADLGILYGGFSPSTFVSGGEITIEFDALLDEQAEFKSDVTQYEVEEGSPVSDHIRNLSDEIRFTGIISNAWLYAETSGDTGQSGGADGNEVAERLQPVFDKLRKLHTDKQTVSVYTRFATYSDMALRSCVIPRNAGDGGVLNFTLEFVKIRKVDTQSVDVPTGISKKAEAKQGGKDGAIAKKSSPQKNAGQTQAKPKDATEPQMQSRSAAILDYLK